jgi:hypothetical protein
MKAAKQNKEQILTWALAYEFVAFLLRAEIAHPRPGRLSNIKSLARILADKTCNISAPVKKERRIVAYEFAVDAENL